jgi:hypothetical protein
MELDKSNLEVILWVLSVSGTIISMMLVVIGFFFKRLIHEVDEHTRGLNGLTREFGSFNQTIVQLQRDSLAKYGSVDERLNETHHDLEKIKDHANQVDMLLEAIKTQGKIKNGWSFSAS